MRTSRHSQHAGWLVLALSAACSSPKPTTPAALPIRIASEQVGGGLGFGSCSKLRVGVAVGFLHTCALLSDATVECWGDNSSNQLGDGTTTPTAAPQPVPGLSGATAITAGDSHTCALMLDGTVQCWGDNSDGRSANGTNLTAPTPVTVPNLTGVTAIAAGADATCAIVGGGSVACWGRNLEGDLGALVGDQSTPFMVPGVSGATSISMASDHACVVINDGTVVCWGGNAYGELGLGTTGFSSGAVSVPGLSGVSVISAGQQHTCAVLNTGEVLCWGSFSPLSSGLPTDETGSFPPSSSTPTPMVDSSGAAVSGAAGIVSSPDTTNSCALLATGGVTCWGDDFNGEFGNGTGLISFGAAVPEPSLDGVESLSIGYTHGCGTYHDGHLECWGNQQGGMLGNNQTAVAIVPPVQVQGGSVDIAGTICRPAAGPCDVAEACDGSNPNCPADQLTVAGQVCGQPTGDCDVAAACSGASADCPANPLVPAGTACGPTPTDLCQTQGSCSGTSGICPGPATLPGAQCVSISSSSNPNTSVDLLGGDSVPGGVSITFGGPFSTDAGTVEIKVVTGSSDPPPPDGYKIVSDPMYWEIEATPGYQDPRVCIGVAPSWGNVCTMALDHFSDGSFQNVTTVHCDGTGHLCCPSTPCPVLGYPCPTSVPPNTICGTTTSFSPFTVTEPIATPPMINVPANIVTEATGPSGAVVTYQVTAIDAQDGPLMPTCMPLSGSAFPVTTTTVICMVNNQEGLGTTSSFAVTVRDSTAPIWGNVPGTIVAYASSTNGAKVTYASPVATDTVDGVRPVTCTPASGSQFKVGKTTVTCTASDKSNNSTNTTFTVWVMYQAPTDGSFFLLPLLANGKAVFPIGPLPLPVVFKLTGASAGITNLKATFSATKISSSVTGTTTVSGITGTTGITPSTGTTFNYVSLLKVYDYLWKISSQTQGTYQITVDLGDGVTHQLNVSLKAIK